ncbi:hypothetical protein RDABS01_032100 [Bienertia sinuspersici]
MDDYSMSSNNYPSQSLTSRPDNSSEESGWTVYFEDFIANNRDNIDNSIAEEQEHAYSFSYSGYQNSLLNSDAAFRNKVGSSKLVSKKVTTKKFVDQELEDTASSPCHSPKVNDLKQLYMKSKELGTQGVCQEKGQTSQHADEGINMGFLETQLRRKGLCLVPMSTLINNLT